MKRFSVFAVSVLIICLMLCSCGVNSGAPDVSSLMSSSVPVSSRRAIDIAEFSIAVSISSDRLLLVEKDMTMFQVMDTLGETCNLAGQFFSSMYYYVDGKELSIDFDTFSDVYPYSGQEMKRMFDTFGAVTYRVINSDDLKLLQKGMTIKEIENTLGNTLDDGSGRHLVKYRFWYMMAGDEFTFDCSDGGLPYSGDEVYNLVTQAMEARFSGGDAEPIVIKW